ncbi:MAG: WD40 repeat domain-containing protein, partial [Bdellovibrionales bacterium]|nr:WD40 repeat domain-containing protein [Bdellovibrionales bacterium]
GTYIFDLNLQQDRLSFSCVDGFLSPDGSKLLCFNYGSAGSPIALKIFDPKNEFQQISAIKSSGYNFQKYFFSEQSNGIFYTLADSYPTYSLNLHYFDLATQEDTVLVSKVDEYVSDEALSPKNKFYVLGYLDKGLKIIDLQTKKEKDTDVIQGQLNDFSFSTDEKYVKASVYEKLENGVYSNSNRIVIFDLASGKVVKTVIENSKIFDSYFVPNKNQLILKLDAEGTIKVIDL